MPELALVPIVIFGNKIDKKESISEDELRDALGLPHHLTFGRGKQGNPGTRPIEIFMCSVRKKVGYQDGFQWMSNFIK